MTPRGLYVHVPFCLKKCHYCNFVISVDAPRAKREAYFEAIERETHEAARRYGKLHFSTLYFGGGTPSSLDAAEAKRLFDLVHKYFTFETRAEVTFEVNPGEVDEEKLRSYKTLGVNRISLGSQSFNDALLREMNRAHDARSIETTMRALKRIGFDNISMDFILRLPGQSMCDVTDSLERAIGLGAKQMVLYDLTVHEGTVWGQRQKRGELPLPNEELHERMALEAEKVLTQAGYDHYELATFAKPGFESAHNLIYWHNGEYLGLGPGAFSYMDHKRYQFATNVERYTQKCLNADWQNDEEEVLEGPKREIETLLTGLRLKPGVPIAHFPLLKDHLAKELPSLEAAGLIERAGGNIRLTPRGRRIPETVFTQLSL